MTKLAALSTTSLTESTSEQALPNKADSDLNSLPFLKKQFIGESIAQRLAHAQATQHPLFSLAKPLLNVLSDIPSRIEQLESVEILRSWLIYELTLFSQLCEQLSIPWRKMTITRYCLCTALDEAIHTTEWGIASGWSQQNLLNYFEEDNDGGNKFFLLAGRLAMDPREYAEVLRVMLHSLNLGFEGRYSIQPEGNQHLTQIRHQLYTLLQPYTAPAQTTVWSAYSPPVLPKRRTFISLRGAALLCLALVTTVYGTYRLLLDYRLTQLTQTALQLTDHIRLPPLPRTALTLPQLLKTDIEQGRLTVDDATQGYRVKLADSAMFASGSAKLLAHHTPVIERIAQATQQLKGSVTLVGHSDSQPVRFGKKSANQQLSLQRAEEVAQLFYRYGFTASQIKVVGVGSRQPLTAHSNIAQRKQNRRVEFFVTLQEE